MPTPFYSFDTTTQNNVNQWLEGQYDETTKTEIRRLLKDHPKQIIDSFYTHLTFGTGGLRGLMGIGTNRLNVYTIRAVTQGLAQYIQTQSGDNQPLTVCIGYDSRQHSREFAEEAAKVLAGNQIQVYLFHELRPTPLVSFACRFLHCKAAVMITASHNPPQYNGYKVYGSDGGQIVSPHDQGIIAEFVKIKDPKMVKTVPSLSHSLIKEIGNEMDAAYLHTIAALQNDPEKNRQKGSTLNIVYTSLHGTGITIVPQVLQSWGFGNIQYVQSQIIPDGSFPNVKSPNPEEFSALKEGIDLLLETKGDLLLATDPDADRVGVVVRHQNQAIQLDGHQIAVLCLEHICSTLSIQKRLSPRAAFIKTISMTELFKAICDYYQRPCFNALTGFKYIAEKIRQWESSPDGYQYLFGGEESYGYLLGTDVRDKDAVLSSALIAEAALHAKLEGKTLVDRLHDLYWQYGIYQDCLLSLNFGETKEGKEQMALGMSRLRDSPLTHVLDTPVTIIEDYLTSRRFDLKSGKMEPLLFPISNILLYWLEDGTRLIIRPSGTEPKVKLYCSACEKNFTTISLGITLCRQRCENLLQFMQQLLNANSF